MSEFSMRATTFKNKFGVAPCDCWKNPYRPAEYHIDPVYKSMGNFGNPRTEEVRVIMELYAWGESIIKVILIDFQCQ